MNAIPTMLRSPSTHRRVATLLVGVTVALASSCGPGGSAPVYSWQSVQTEQPAALLSIWGTSATDVYAVGADSRDGFGPQVLHYDGTKWTRLATGQSTGDLWWVQGIGDTVWMGGSPGMILKYDTTTHTFTKQMTPGRETIFGIWGATASDVWAVGGNANGAVNGVAGVVWHYDGSSWTNMQLPNGLGATSVLFKVWGSSVSDVWAVGDQSATLHWNGTAWSQVAVASALQARLFTVHGQGMQRYAVGGVNAGILLESNDTTGTWTQVAGTFPQLRGVYAPVTGGAVAVGAQGSVYHRDEMGVWHPAANGPQTDYDFHAVWVDPTGNIWAVGGQLNANPTAHGMIFHYGTAIADAGPVQYDPQLLACSDTSGTICTWAGTLSPGFNGDAIHRRLSTLYWPIDMEFNGSDQPYVLDWNNHRVRRLNTVDQTFETVIGTEVPGDGDMAMGDLVPPGVLGTTVSLNHPTDILFEADGTLTLMAWHNHKIRRWNPATGLAYVWVGRGPGAAGDGMPVNAMTRLKQPSKFAYDSHHNLFIFDQGNVKVRRIADADQMVTLIAGNGMKGFMGDGGDPLMAEFNVQTGENPEPSGGLAIDSMDRIFIADSDNNRIRMIDLTANTITTVVGTGTMGHGGDGGPALQAELNSPRDIEFFGGDLYIADTDNHCVRKVTMATMTISTVAGTCGTAGFGGDNGPATSALLSRPFGIAFDHHGTMFISDTYNNVIRRVAP